MGASTGQDNGLNLVYESSDNFGALTSFGVIPAMAGLAGLVSGKVPGLEINLANVLHGEQFTELLADQFPTEGTLMSTFKILAILDKGSGAVYVLDILSKDKETGQDIVKNQISIFVVGAGGFGGPRNSNLVIEALPKPERAPDHSKSYKTSIDQVTLH